MFLQEQTSDFIPGSDSSGKLLPSCNSYPTCSRPPPPFFPPLKTEEEAHRGMKRHLLSFLVLLQTVHIHSKCRRGMLPVIVLQSSFTLLQATPVPLKLGGITHHLLGCSGSRSLQVSKEQSAAKSSGFAAQQAALTPSEYWRRSLGAFLHCKKQHLPSLICRDKDSWQRQQVWVGRAATLCQVAPRGICPLDPPSY